MAEMGRCRDCRHWDSEDISYGVCTQASFRPWGNSWQASAYGTNGETGYLNSTPDFGCVEFKAKAE